MGIDEKMANILQKIWNNIVTQFSCDIFLINLMLELEILYATIFDLAGFDIFVGIIRFDTENGLEVSFLRN